MSSVKIAKERVALRVSKGGHYIPDEVIERRYVSGIKNLFEFIEIVNDWFLYKNDNIPPELIAEGDLTTTTKIHNLDVWELLKKI